ncbi:PAS domain-containing sensor histidine kinase [Inhella sp.]|uniref:sensor histidine kinase n=1 Tax=Inhella sp. TaxID=1921806 RepID=UPI0035ADD4AC
MGSERWRALAGLALAVAAGAAAGQASARWLSAAALLLLAALALGWPRRVAVPPQPEPPAPAPPPDALARLQIQLEHLPAASWVLTGAGRLQPLSQRARRLLAPGAVQDAAALQALLIERARAGQAGQLQLETERGSERWSLALQPLQLAGEAQVLLVLLPLESALESERLLAWQQLVQVLTHEIMNSLTPIASLSQGALELLDDPEAGDELRLALDTIAQRAAGLQRFVADYRRLSQLPPPQLEPVDLGALLARLQAAVAPAWAARGGAAQVDLAHPGLRLQADPAQLEQALLNLIRNAENATCDTPQPRLWVEARLSRGGRLRISVRDNGPGVPAGLEQQIFLPFFSATPGGHGIGLTLTRQLVHGMGGRLRHARPLEGGAAFVLSF